MMTYLVKLDHLDGCGEPCIKPDCACFTKAQVEAILAISERYGVEPHLEDYINPFDLPDGWKQGWVGGEQHGFNGGRQRTIYIGVSPEGEVHS